MALTTVGSLRGAASRGLAAALVLAAVLGGCSAGDGDDADDASTAGGGVVPIATLPPVETTVLVTSSVTTTAVATTAVATTAVATTQLTTTVPTTARPTTTVASGPPCDINTVVAQTQTAYQGVTPTELRCAEGWAAWIGQPNDQLSDGYFAVASWNGSSWELVNLGTSFICTDAGVPDRLWDTLGCFE